MVKGTQRDTFEQLYGKLEERVGKLEKGGLSLEEAIALYEEGMQIARQCQERLDEAEMKITKLRESFASLPPRNGGALRDMPADYEYVAEDEAAFDDDEPLP